MGLNNQLTNFRDGPSPGVEDALLMTLNGQTEVCRVVGATGHLQFVSGARRIHTTADTDQITLLADDSKATGGFFEAYGQAHVTGLGGATISIHDGGYARIRSAPLTSTASVLRWQVVGVTGDVEHTPTWNVGGTTFTALKTNVTDTASAAASLLADFQIGAVSQFQISKAGVTTQLGSETIRGTAATDAAVMGVELLDAGFSAVNWAGGPWPAAYTHTPGVGNIQALSHTIAGIGAGLHYQVGFTIAGAANGTVTVTMGGVTLLAAALNNGVFLSGPIAAGAGDLAFTPTFDYDGVVSAITVKQVTTTAGAAIYLRDSANAISVAIRAFTAALNNTAVGNNALQWNTTGSGNSAFGSSALATNSTGGSNSAFGYRALYTNSTASSNSAFGYQALFFNSTGVSNNAFGTGALQSNSSGVYNSAFGSFALLFNATGNYNSAFGVNALYTNSSGSANSAFGQGALNKATVSNLSAFGYAALAANTTGTPNSAFGVSALTTNTIGISNSAFGMEALKLNLSGNYNCAFGGSALATNSTGVNNCAFGFEALKLATAGNNTALGNQAGAALTTGTDNILIGNGVNASAVGATYELNIGGIVQGKLDTYSTKFGYQASTNRYGQQAQANGRFAADGDAQVSRMIARAVTTGVDANTELFLDGAGATQRCTIASGKVAAYKVTVAAKNVTSGVQDAGYTFEGVIRNRAGTTSLTQYAKVVLHEDDANWDCDVVADDGNDSIKVQVTGVAVTTIRWVARIELTEVSA